MEEMPVEGGQAVIAYSKGYICDGSVAHQQKRGPFHAQMMDVLHGRHACESNHIPLQGGFAQAACLY